MDKMTVAEEWRGHAHDLRRISIMLKNRPTLGIDEQIENLLDVADQIDAEANHYEAEETSA